MIDILHVWGMAECVCVYGWWVCVVRVTLGFTWLMGCLVRMRDGCMWLMCVCRCVYVCVCEREREREERAHMVDAGALYV